MYVCSRVYGVAVSSLVSTLPRAGAQAQVAGASIYRVFPVTRTVQLLLHYGLVQLELGCAQQPNDIL